MMEFLLHQTFATLYLFGLVVFVELAILVHIEWTWKKDISGRNLLIRQAMWLLWIGNSVVSVEYLTNNNLLNISIIVQTFCFLLFAKAFSKNFNATV